MQRQIRQVRRSIRRRRENKRVIKPQTSSRTMTPLITEHERHGDVQLFPDDTPIKKITRRRFSAIYFKGIAASILFVLSFIVFKTDMIPLSSSKDWFEKQLTKEFPFAAVNAWYHDRFGRPLAFNPQFNTDLPRVDRQALPVIGEVSEPFHLNGEGIKISSEVTTPVKAWEDGIVIFAGNDHSTKKTVTIQHADESETSYGFLSTIDVHLYQYVAAGQVIGMFDPELDQKEVYFSIEKDDSFIDPIQVIHVDER